MKKKTDKQRLFEVMSRLDKTFKRKLNEETDKGMEIVYTFKNEAITKTLQDPNSKTYTYPVHILKGDPKYGEKYGGLILSISNTPGAWYVDTLMESPVRRSDYIYIDAGQGWACVNWDVIMGELEQWLSEYEKSVEYEEPSDPEVGHNEYLKQSDQLKSFDDDSVEDKTLNEVEPIGKEITLYELFQKNILSDQELLEIGKTPDLNKIIVVDQGEGIEEVQTYYGEGGWRTKTYPA